MSLVPRYCTYCKGELEEGECNLRNGDETDIYWFCTVCEWDERDQGIDFDFEWNNND